MHYPSRARPAPPVCWGLPPHRSCRPAIPATAGAPPNGLTSRASSCAKPRFSAPRICRPSSRMVRANRVPATVGTLRMNEQSSEATDRSIGHPRQVRHDNIHAGHSRVVHSHVMKRYESGLMHGVRVVFGHPSGNEPDGVPLRWVHQSRRARGTVGDGRPSDRVVDGQRPPGVFDLKPNAQAAAERRRAEVSHHKTRRCARATRS